VDSFLKPDVRYPVLFSQYNPHGAIAGNLQKYTGTSGKIHYCSPIIQEYVNNVSTMVKGGWVGTQNLYYDASTGSYLGGTWSESVQGVVKKQEEYNGTAYAQRRPEDHPAGSLGIAPFGEMNISFTDEGVESVTVPYGSYPDARNYSGTYKNGMPIAFWVASGVPVPVKYQFSDWDDSDGKDPLDVFELAGWG